MTQNENYENYTMKIRPSVFIWSMELPWSVKIYPHRLSLCIYLVTHIDIYLFFIGNCHYIMHTILCFLNIAIAHSEFSVIIQRSFPFFFYSLIIFLCIMLKTQLVPYWWVFVWFPTFHYHSAPGLTLFFIPVSHLNNSYRSNSKENFKKFDFSF